MAIYAIGDVQGCFDALQRLLEKIAFDPERDTLWFTGDLVNRGPDSLQTLRFVQGLGDKAVTVLGNHDLHLLAVDAGVDRLRTKSDTLDAILEAPDREPLLDWLRTRPLIHFDETTNTALLHAGLPPQWSIDDARRHAGEVERALRNEKGKAFFRHMYGNRPDYWSDELEGWKRLRFIVNCFTRMRYCTPEGRVDFTAKGKPGTQPRGLRPWFDIPDRRSRNVRIVFGHWSTLGLHLTENIAAIDTGCLWGGALTALRVDGETGVTQFPCPMYRQPG